MGEGYGCLQLVTRPNDRSHSIGRGALQNIYKVYVLQDNKGRLYKGMTNNLERRLREYQSGKTRTTSHMDCLEIIYTESFCSFAEARKRELYLKSAAGRRFLKKVLGDR